MIEAGIYGISIGNNLGGGVMRGLEPLQFVPLVKGGYLNIGYPGALVMVLVGRHFESPG